MNDQELNIQRKNRILMIIICICIALFTIGEFFIVCSVYNQAGWLVFFYGPMLMFVMFVILPIGLSVTAKLKGYKGTIISIGTIMIFIALYFLEAVFELLALEKTSKFGSIICLIFCIITIVLIIKMIHNASRIKQKEENNEKTKKLKEEKDKINEKIKEINQEYKGTIFIYGCISIICITTSAVIRIFVNNNTSDLLSFIIMRVILPLLSNYFIIECINISNKAKLLLVLSWITTLLPQILTMMNLSLYPLFYCIAVANTIISILGFLSKSIFKIKIDDTESKIEDKQNHS